MPNELPVPYHPIQTLTSLEEIRQTSLSTLSQFGSEPYHLGNVAGVKFVLGEANTALSDLRQAVRSARDTGHLELTGYLLNLQAAVLCYLGQYRAGCEAFEQAEVIFSQTGDLLGMAWKQHIYAREFERDLGNYHYAYTQALCALPILRSRATPQAVIENLLTQADCNIHLGEPRRAADNLRQAEGLIAEHKSLWYLPELYLLRAQLALAENNHRQAWQQGYYGLGAVGHSGDLRMLAALYATLGIALEHDRTRLADARDAFNRAILAGRERARRLHLALALKQMGLHLKRFSNRPTARARGSGFLFEASQMFSEMGLTDQHAPRRAAAGD